MGFLRAEYYFYAQKRRQSSDAASAFRANRYRETPKEFADKNTLKHSDSGPIFESTDARHTNLQEERSLHRIQTKTLVSLVCVTPWESPFEDLALMKKGLKQFILRTDFHPFVFEDLALMKKGLKPNAGWSNCEHSTFEDLALMKKGLKQRDVYPFAAARVL